MGRRNNRIASPKKTEEESTLANLVHEGLDRLAQGIAIYDSELRRSGKPNFCWTWITHCRRRSERTSFPRLPP